MSARVMMLVLCRAPLRHAAYAMQHALPKIAREEWPPVAPLHSEEQRFEGYGTPGKPNCFLLWTPIALAR
jgi:hypothetical protein